MPCLEVQSYNWQSSRTAPTGRKNSHPYRQPHLFGSISPFFLSFCPMFEEQVPFHANSSNKCRATAITMYPHGCPVGVTIEWQFQRQTWWKKPLLGSSGTIADKQVLYTGSSTEPLIHKGMFHQRQQPQQPRQSRQPQQSRQPRQPRQPRQQQQQQRRPHVCQTWPP